MIDIFFSLHTFEIIYVVSCHIFSERQPVYDQVDDCQSGDEHV